MIAVSKVVEIKTSESSFIYIDKLKDGTHRVAYTTDQAEAVKKMRDEGFVTYMEKGK